MSGAWGDSATSQSMRDLITAIVRNVLASERPTPRYATVNSINRATRRCMVTFTGGTTSVPVSMGSVQPHTTGQTVRVAGPPNDRYIEAVLGIQHLPAGTIELADGSNATPSLHFSADTNTGLRRVSADRLAVVTGGVQRMFADNSGVQMDSGRLLVTSATNNNIQSSGTGAGFLFSDRNGTADYNLLYRSANVAYLYSSAAAVDLVGFDDIGNVKPRSGRAAAMNLGAWSADPNWSASMEGLCGYLLLGNSTGSVNTPVYLRSKGTGVVNIGAHGTDTLTVGNGVIHANNNKIHLRAVTDLNHWLQWQGTISSISVDGPVLNGFAGVGFATGGTLRSYVNSAGDLLVMAGIDSGSFTGSNATLRLASNSARTGLSINSHSASAVIDFFASFYDITNGFIGSIRSAASSSTTSYNTTSDYRLKEEVEPLISSLERLRLLKPITFKWRNTPNSRIEEGFIAHEVQEVVPSAISGEKDAVDAEGNPDMQQMELARLVPLLTGALQEAHELIKNLTERVSALESPSLP